MSRGAALLASLVLAGCAVGPDYQKPSVEVPAAYKEAGDWKVAQPRDDAGQGEWWGVFGDPTLDALIEQVEISNQNVLAAEAQFRRAQAIVAASRSAYFPTVSANASIVRSRSPTGVVGGTTAGRTITNRAASLDAGWEPDLWGRIRRQIESDSAAAQASAAGLANARLSAQANVAINYFSMRISEQRILLFQASVAAFARSAQIVQNQLDAGIVSRVDLAQAQTQLEQTRAQLVAENINRATFEHAVAVLVGKSPSAFSLEPGPLPDEVPTFDAGVPSALLERRPDIASAERQMASANAQIGVAQAAYYPDISLASTVTLVASSLLPLLQLSNAVWSVGPQLAATLVDGGALKAQVEGARAKYDGQVALYRQTILVAFQQIEDALVQQRVLVMHSYHCSPRVAPSSRRIWRRPRKPGALTMPSRSMRSIKSAARL